MAQDKICSAELPFTQEFLAQMLAVQRTTVNAFATSLANAALIQYPRGKVMIVDRAGLQMPRVAALPWSTGSTRNYTNCPSRSELHKDYVQREI